MPKVSFVSLKIHKSIGCQLYFLGLHVKKQLKVLGPVY